VHKKVEYAGNGEWFVVICVVSSHTSIGHQT
jgi:hypothetical protein